MSARSHGMLLTLLGVATAAPGAGAVDITRGGKPLLHEGEHLVRLPVAGLDAAGTREQGVEVAWKNGTPEVELVLAPQTVNIYRVQRAAR